MLKNIMITFVVCIFTLTIFTVTSFGLSKCKLSDCHSNDSAEGRAFIIRPHGSPKLMEVDLQTAMQHFKRFRWVHVNSSCKNLDKAKQQMIKISKALGAPKWMPGVLLYLSRGIGGDDNHQIVKDRLKFLLNEIVREDKHVLVTSKSYAHHVVLSALRNYGTKRILHISISPAFGAFGGVFNDWDKVKQYIEDIRTTNTAYCMIASDGDGYTTKAGGAAWWDGRKVGYNNVYDAVQANSSFVHVYVLSGAEHCPIDFYINAGLVGAMQKCSNRFGFDGTFVDDIVHGREMSWLTPIIWSY